MEITNQSTNMKTQIRHCHNRRRGQVAVEFAMVAPLIFLFVFGAVEFGRALMVIHCMEGAAHAGCRAGVVKGATAEDVKAACETQLRSAGITKYEGDLSPQSLSTAKQWDPVTVTLTTNYGDISWLPVPDFLGDIQLSATCTLPREAKSDQNSN